jgi:hypothetical protein
MIGRRNPMRLAMLFGLCASAGSVHAYPTAESFSEHIEGPQNRGIDRPSINPTPHKTLLLTGQKDPRIELRFALTYITQDEACQSQTFAGHLAGAPEVPGSIDDWVRVPVGQSTFSITLFLDRYMPGRCGWYPIAILHAQFEPGVNTGPLTISGVAAIRAEGKPSVKLTLICRQATPSSRPQEKPVLRCLAVNHSADDMIIAADGGVVTIDVSMVAGSGE